MCLHPREPDCNQRSGCEDETAGSDACRKACPSQKSPCSSEKGAYREKGLHVNILQVEYGGTIIPVKLAVYDNDGQEGIFIPGSMEANAVKEVAANLGQNLGTSISITNQSAGDQLLSELGRGAIQGVSQYISKKMREEKVHLKSGYGLMLYQNNNQ